MFLTALMSILILSSANSYAGVYGGLGGSCASQGSWTEQALANTQSLIDVINQLKANPACKVFVDESGVSGSATGLVNLLSNETINSRSGHKLQTLPRDISALHNYLSTDRSSNKESLLNLLVGKTIEQVSMGGVMSPEVAVGLEIGQSLKDRLGLAAEVGVKHLNRLIMAMPDLDECLVGQPDLASRFLLATVNTTAALASSDTGPVALVTDAIANLLNQIQKRKFTKSLRDLHRVELWNSISCLIESTTQTYCVANEAKQVLNYNLKNDWKKVNSQTESTPLEGYFLLSRESYIISKWLGEVLIGVDPKWETDAQLKNLALDSNTSFQKQTNQLRAIYAQGVFNMNNQPGTFQKQNFVFKMLQRVVNLIQNDFDGTTNFFTMSKNARLLPFYLIGISEIPDRVSGKGQNGGYPLEWDQYMQTNGPKGTYIKEFENPEELAEVIGVNLRKLIQDATDAAAIHFMKNYIVDHQNLISSASTAVSPNLTVYDSLKNIAVYLKKVRTRTVNVGGDKMLLPLVEDTLSKVSDVIAEFDRIRDLKSTDLKVRDEEMRKTLETVFLKFNMLLQRQGFLMNRMQNIVLYDFGLRTRSGEKMSPFQKELLVLAGKDLYERYNQMVSLNPSASALDLDNALTVNDQNLLALESFFRDNMHPMLQFFQMAATMGPGVTRSDYNQQSWSRMFGDLFGHMMEPLPVMIQKLFNGSYLGIDAYDSLPGGWQSLTAVDSDAFKTIHAKLCVQSLAFSGGDQYQEFCKGVVLKGQKDPSSKGTMGMALNVNYDKLLESNFRTSWYGGKVYVNSMDRVCAFRNYMRRNQVYWMINEMNGGSGSP